MTHALTILLLLIAIAGCAGSSGTRQQHTTPEGDVVTTYDDATHGLRLTFPGDWDEVTLMKPRDAVLLLAPPNKGKGGAFPPAVAVVAPSQTSKADASEPDERRLDAMQQRAIDKARGEMSDFQLVETSETTVGGEPARRIVYTGSKLGQPLQVMYVLTLHAGRPYAFSYMSAPATFDDHRSAVERVVASAQWAR